MQDVAREKSKCAFLPAIVLSVCINYPDCVRARIAEPRFLCREKTAVTYSETFMREFQVYDDAVKRRLKRRVKAVSRDCGTELASGSFGL